MGRGIWLGESMGNFVLLGDILNRFLYMYVLIILYV